jgi:hypothetical protein
VPSAVTRPLVGFAASTWSDKHRQLARIHVEVGSAQRVHFGIAAAVDLHDVVAGYQGLSLI